MDDATDATTTLSVLNTATEWFDDSRSCALRCEDHKWYMVHKGENGRRLNVYVCPEQDIRDAWRTQYPDKPLPLAACDDDSVPDPGVLLLQAESRFRIHAYFFIEDDIDDWGIYAQPVSALLHSMRVRIRWMVTLLSWRKRVTEKAYAPGGAGAKRARESFEQTATALAS